MSASGEAPSRSSSEERAPSVSIDARAWLRRAQSYAATHDWERSRDCASKAIEGDSSLIEAYMVRAIALRVIGGLDEAANDYTSVIEIDPQHGPAWMFRGACRAQKASSEQDTKEKTRLLNEAYPDYRRAAELMPDNEQAGLALLELEICAGKYREAVGTTGTWWNRLQGPHNKLICAWLACIAFILACKPEKRWAHFWEFLETEPTRLGPTEWSVAEISGLLETLESQGICDQAKLREVRKVHETFIQHFSGGGPAIER